MLRFVLSILNALVFIDILLPLMLPLCRRLTYKAYRSLSIGSKGRALVPAVAAWYGGSSQSAVFGTCLALAVGAAATTTLASECDSAASGSADVPLMTLAQMEKMREDGRVVVSFQGIVYDVTDFTGMEECKVCGESN